jgi:hypothetical protein
MNLEQSIEHLASALELIASKLGAAVPATPAETPTPKTKKVSAAPALAPEPAPVVSATTVTIEQVRAVGQKVVAAGKQAEMKAIFVAAGAEKLSLIAADKYPEVLKSLEKLLTA